MWYDQVPVLTAEITNLPHEIDAKCQPVHWNIKLNWYQDDTLQRDKNEKNIKSDENHFNNNYYWGRTYMKMVCEKSNN